MTTNFKLKEFTNLKQNQLSAPQDFMITRLSFVLEEVRSILGSVPVVISNGLRDLQDFYRLLDLGYYPSPTSDHFFGLPVPIAPNNKKHPIFKDIYSYSVGAADIIPKMDVRDAFEILVQKVRENEGLYFITPELSFGQLIYERLNEKEWIHISNSPLCIYDADFALKCLNRQPILESFNGGKTYSIIYI